MGETKSVLERILDNKKKVSSQVAEHEKTYEEKKKEEKDRLKKNPFLNTDKYAVNPKNAVNKRLIVRLESMTSGIEKQYFWLLRFLKGSPNPSLKGRSLEGFGIHAFEVYKLKDQFDASVSSSFHGNIGSKVSAIQQQVSTYLAQIGQMTKTIFPIVREIRVMDERMAYYKDSMYKKSDEYDKKKLAREAEIALKSTWIEVVEQGMQNPNSVYSMATKLGFITLPDLFFSVNADGETPAKQRTNMGKYVKQMRKDGEINEKVMVALIKKLYQYYTWKEKTWYEMQHTYKFRIKNLRQHYNVIRLYMSWLKPHLTTLKSLQMQNQDSPELVSAFETSKLELELLGVIKKGKFDVDKKGNKRNACLLARITHVTKPEMNYGPGGQRQPSHMGDIIVSFEAYVATDQQIQDYRNYCDKKVMELIPGEEFNMIQDITDAMDSLGDDVKAYLLEAEGKKLKDKEEEEKKPVDFFEPVKALFSGFDIFIPKFKKKKDNDDESIVYKKDELRRFEEEGDKLKSKAKKVCWKYYDIFKKTNGLLTP